MLKNSCKSKTTDTPKRYVLMLYVFLNCLISASGQILSNYQIVELININVLQIDIHVVENTINNKLDNWILSNGNASLLIQGGNKNYALIDQLIENGNTAKVLEQDMHNRSIKYATIRECIIYQSGSRNYTSAKQVGSQNRSEAFQHGNMNEINIAQRGIIEFSNNYANSVKKTIVLQTGYKNCATINQSFYP